jgi:hypothetical protein
MNKSINIAAIFPKHLFWDMDHSKLNLYRDADIIIPRALFATTPETFEADIQKLEQYYFKNIILKYLKNTKERISNEVCAMVAKRYNVPTFARFKQV